MAQSGARQKERLRILSWLIACAFFFTAASPPATAQFKAWVMAKLPDTPEGLGVDSHGNLYATLMHIGEVVMLNCSRSMFITEQIGSERSKSSAGRWLKNQLGIICGLSVNAHETTRLRRLMIATQ